MHGGILDSVETKQEELILCFLFPHFFCHFHNWSRVLCRVALTAAGTPSPSMLVRKEGKGESRDRAVRVHCGRGQIPAVQLPSAAALSLISKKNLIT